MVMPLRAVDLLPRPTPSLRLLPAPPLDLEPERLEGLNREVASALQEIETFELEVKSSFEAVRAVARDTSGTEEGRQSLEEMVEALREVESKLASTWSEVEASIERAILRARQLGSQETLWTKYADLLDHSADSTIRLLETLRDMRWELAAILTAVDEGDSPVFDDPAALKKYLQSI
jgi:chromosome segregation ATPase